MSKVTLDSQQMADLAVGLFAAVRWYSQAVEGYANEDSANPGKLHFQQQLDRLRELQRADTDNPCGPGSETTSDPTGYRASSAKPEVSPASSCATGCRG